MRLLCYVSLIFSLAFCSGCGSFYGRMYGPPTVVYSGVRADTWLAFQGYPKHPLFVIDYPFSAVADTLLLPVDLWPESPPTNPLAGWKPLYGREEEKVDEAIKSDYQSFIQTLPPNQQGYNVGPIFLSENGDGQHAVSFEVFVSGNSSWHYAIIYDKDNKRVKVIKYGYNRYMS